MGNAESIETLREKEREHNLEKISFICDAKKEILNNQIVKNIKINKEKINYVMSIILNRKRMDYVDVEENIEKILCNTNSSSFLWLKIRDTLR